MIEDDIIALSVLDPAIESAVETLGLSRVVALAEHLGPNAIAAAAEVPQYGSKRHTKDRLKLRLAIAMSLGDFLGGSK